MIVCVILSKKVHMNMGPILNLIWHWGWWRHLWKFVEMCQTPTNQGFVHGRSSITDWWVPACMWCYLLRNCWDGLYLLFTIISVTVQYRTHVNINFFA
jgi:hypothetical protein